MEVKKKYLKVETRPEEDKSNVQSSSLQDNLKTFWISITEDEEHIKQIEKSFTNTIKSWISYIKNKVRYFKNDTSLLRIDLESANDLANIIKPFIVPSKAIMWFYIKNEEVPDGWVICDGRWYSVDGKQSSTTPNAICKIQTPNLIGKYALGSIKSETGVEVDQKIPSITNKPDTFNSKLSAAPLNGDTLNETSTEESNTGTSTNNMTFNISITRPMNKLVECLYGKKDILPFDLSITRPIDRLVECMYDHNFVLSSIKLLPCMKL